MNLDPMNALIEIVIMILSAGAIYGAIRMDIKNIHEKIKKNESDISSAHGRINDMLRDEVSHFRAQDR